MRQKSPRLQFFLRRRLLLQTARAARLFERCSLGIPCSALRRWPDARCRSILQLKAPIPRLPDRAIFLYPLDKTARKDGGGRLGEFQFHCRSLPEPRLILKYPFSPP